MVFTDDLDKAIIKNFRVCGAKKIIQEDIDDDMSEVGLAGLGAQRRKLGAVEGDKVVVLGMFVFKRLKHLGGIIGRIFRTGRPQKSTC